MALEVEDGTGKTNADALISLAYADSYHTARGNMTWTGDDADKEVAIRRASAHLTFAYRWQGYKAQGRDQAMAWPRSWVVDAEGWSVDADEVPVEIQQACAELALAELVDPGTLTPTVTPSTQVKREKVGPLEVEYIAARTDPGAERPVLLIVRDLVGRFLSKTSSGLVGQANRV